MNAKERVQSLKEWNYHEEHCRKILKAKGYYVRNGKQIGKSHLLEFWGEWEPESKVSEPQYRVHEPVLFKNANGKILTPDYVADIDRMPIFRQNTDPFVFGKDGFLYSLCRQVRGGIKTAMRYLEPGSIIVFGSCLDKRYFAVDTVFVVKTYCDYNPICMELDLKNFIPNSREYEDIMGPITCASVNSLRCYKGASPTAPLCNMYSYAPCRKFIDNANPFQRPILSTSSFATLRLSTGQSLIISDKLYTNYRCTEGLSLTDMKQIWDILYDVLIKKTGLLPGTQFFYGVNKVR